MDLYIPFSKANFSETSTGTPFFSFQSTKRHDELCMCKVKKKICPLEEFVIYVLKGLLQCKMFIEKSDKTLPENANKKNLSVLRCIYPEKSRIKHQIFTCPKIDNQKNRKNQFVCMMSRMCKATIHIGTSVQLAWNVYRFKPLYYIEDHIVYSRI